MFEEWVGDVLTRFVGHFLDVKRDQLRVSLWSGWSTSMTLENVRLKVEAFDYLQLPINITEGCIGRLVVQVPWRALQSRPVVVEMSDVWLCASPRKEEEWEEDLASQRAQAAKQAELAARDLMRLSRPGSKGATGSSATPEGSGFAWSFLSHLSSMVLNRLQMTISNVHICFQEGPKPGMEPLRFGVRLSSLQTERTGKGSLGAIPEGMQVIKDMRVDGLSVYWCPAKHLAGADPDSPIAAWLGSMEQSTVPGLPPDMHDILPSLSFDLRLTTKYGERGSSPGMVLGISIHFQRLGMCLQQSQLASIRVFGDQVQIWQRRGSYALLRPNGWRSNPDSRTSPSLVWRFAIRAVLQDLGRHRRWLTLPDLVKRRQRRLKYQQLYLKRVEKHSASKEAPNEVQGLEQAEDAELEALEAELSVSDILLFRTMAERQAQNQKAAALTTQQPEEEEVFQDATEVIHQNWLSWSVTSVAGYVGWVPGKDAPSQPAAPSEEDIQGLYRDLEFDPQAHENSGRPAGSAVGIKASVHVNAAILTLTEDVCLPELADAAKVLALELGGLEVDASWLEGELCVDVTSADIMAHDLSSLHLGTSDTILMRWTDGEEIAPQPSMDLPSPFADPLSSFLLSHSTAAADTGEPEPALHVIIKAPLPASSSQSPLQVAQVTVLVQPLQLQYQPSCFARLAKIVASPTGRSRTAELMDVISAHDSLAVQSLSVAELACSSQPLPAISLEVLGFKVILGGGQGTEDNSALQLAVSTGPVKVSCQESSHSQLASALLQEMQQYILQQDDGWRPVFSQIEQQVMYNKFDFSLDSLAVIAFAGPAGHSGQQGGSNVLFPLSMTGSAELRKLPYKRLPQAKVWLSAEIVEVTATPQHLQLLTSLAEQHKRQRLAILAAEKSHPPQNQGAPLLELHASIAGVLATYDDGGSQLADAADTHLGLHVGPIKADVDVSCDALHLQAHCAALQLDDRSRYTVLPPRVWGLIPRLASRMRIEQVKAIFSREAGQGLMLSLELHDCEATGFQNEPGNFICRYRRAPPVGRVTYSESPELRKTSITLQDGCFGAGALMRIAAMFVRPNREGSVQDSAEVEVQAAPVAAVGDITSVPEPPPSSIADDARPHRTDSAASGSDASAMTSALEEGSIASPGQKSSSSHSRDSGFWQAWKASGSSPLPFEDIFEDPTGASSTPPDGGSRPSSRNTDSSGAEQPTSASDPKRGAPQDTLQSAVEDTALSSADVPPADDIHGDGQCAADAERHSRDAASRKQAAPRRKDQFSLEILRCRAVAPDWQDTSATSSRPYWDRQHALTLNVPQLLLQLPPTNPAKHPSKHPVEVHSFDSASASTPAAQHDTEEVSKHESSTPSVPEYETSAQREATVISAVQLAFHVEVFDPGKASHVGYTSPFISIPDISMAFQGIQPACSVTPDSSASRPVLLPATGMQIPNAILDITPGRLAVVLAAITWARGELAHILGQTAKQTPHQHRPPAMPLMPRLMRLSPVIAAATVQKCSLRLRGASPLQPALQLDMTGLEAEAVRLPEEAVGLRVKLPLLHLALMGLPESSDANDSAPDNERLEKASRSPQGLGRSASAPSPPLMRAETPSLKLEPITPWMPDDTADFQSSSSVGSDSSPLSQLGDRTVSTGLAEATMLGSSPDETSQPVFTARQASGALSTLGIFRGSPEGSASPLSSRRSSVDSAGNVVRFLDARSGSLSTASMHRLSSGSSTGSASGNAMYDAVSSQQYFSDSSDIPSGSGLAMFDARSSVSSDRSEDPREAMYDASSSAFSNRLHRVSSNGTNTSSNSGTEWYEAGDADSSTPRTGSFIRDEERTPQPDEAPTGKMLSLALFTAVESSAAGMLGHACDALPSTTALLKATEVAGNATILGHLGPVMLRLFTEGWDLALTVLKSYRDALPQASAPEAANGRGSAAMGPEQSLQQSASSLTVHLVVVDVIATSYKGDSSRVPCATLGLATRLEAHTESSALTDMVAKDIRVALSCGSSEGTDDISRITKHDPGMLFALRDGQGKVTFPSSAPGTKYEMALNGGNMVLWASQSRLCLAALFLQAARDAASTLTAAGGTAVVPHKASRPSREQQLGTLDVSIQSAVVHMASDTGGAERPLAELCLNRLGGRLELEEQSLSWELDVQLALNIFSASHAGWEPVLEPWRCQILGAAPIAWAGRNLVFGSGMRIGLSSTEVLNLTATYTVFDAIEGLRRLVRHARDGAASPDVKSLLEGSKENALSSRSAAGVLHRVQNSTELSLECWIAPPSQPTQNGFETVLVEPAAAASLPSAANDSPTASSGSAGDMSHFFDDSEQSAVALSASTSMATLQLAASKRRARPERLALFYMLAGQEGLANTIPLSRESRGFHSMTLRPGTSSGTYRVSVAYDVAVQRHVETTVTLHSGVQIINSTTLSLSIGEQSSGKKVMTVLATIAPGEAYSLPVLRKEPGLISVRPAGAGAAPEESQYQWSPSVRLQPLLDGVQANTTSEEPARPRPRVARHLSCQATQSGLLQASFCIGVRPSTARAGWDLVVKAPLVVENMLPMPAEFLIRRKPSGQTPMRVFLQPKQLAYLHHTDIHHLDGVIVQAQGYQRSTPVRVPALQRSSDAAGGMERAGSMDGADEGQAVSSFQIASMGESSSTTSVQLAHTQDQECGGHILQISCGLWVYNCTDMPLALQQGDLDVSQQQDPNEVTMDEVPKDWLPPYEGEGNGSSLFRPESDKRAASKPSLQSKRQGMQQIMGSRRAGEVTTTPTRTRSTSRFGVAESLEGLPSYTQPSRWPSMRGSAAPGRRRLRVQLRVSNMRAPYGRSFWSEPLQLDALGGAAIVSVPCPGPSPSYAQPDARAAYALSVSASQVPGTSGALALVIMPRYVLRNSLGQAVQFRQQETMLEKELAPGASRPLRWTDAALPRRLSVRIQDAGWLWSGGFALDTPGDIFVNIRHRDRGETRLVRVDICSTKGGVLIVNMSHQAAGFAPYRLDNCSPEVLHVRQLGCEEQQDILRPYSTINYAWDEPSLPHKLVLSLPGNRVLGIFELDKVGFRRVMGLPGDYSHQWRERQLLVMITAEGPTCVLTIADLQKHEISPADDMDNRHGDRLGWQPWSSPGISKAPASQRGAAVSAALHAEVHAELAGFGLSIATPEAEVLYMLLDGIRVRATSSKVSRTVETCIRSIQVDNPQRDAIFPVGFLSPAPVASLGLSMLPEAALPSSSAARAPALCGRVAVWQRTPAGVRCFERVEVHMGPALLEADQQHLDQVLAALQHALKPLRKLLPSTSSEEEGTSDVDVLVASYNRAPTQERKVYIACMHISPINVTISFLPAELQRRDHLNPNDITGTALGTGLQRLVALVGEVEGGRITLAPLHMEHPLLGMTALQQQVQSHYLRAALPELVKLVGSANVLGDPAKLIHHLGLGVWSFLASPASGLVEGARRGAPERIAAGMLDGTRGLITNTVYAFSNATAKMSGAARKGLAALGLEPAESRAGLPLRARLRSRARDNAAPEANPGLLGALLNGVVGILSEPVRGAEQGGVPGLLRGASRGAAGALVQPLAFALETSVAVADSLRSAIMGIPPLLPRARPPRHVAADEPLAVYNWSEAMGRALLLELERGRHAGEGFLLCRQLAASSDFAVLTEQHLLCIVKPSQSSAPALRWAVALQDVFHFDRDQQRMCLVALPSGAVKPTRTLALLRRPLVVRPPSWPFFSASLQCQSAEDADMLCQGLHFTTQHGRALAFSPVLERQLITRQGVAGQGVPSWDS